MNEQSFISELKGVGEKTERILHKLEIYTIGDMLRHYPRGYDIYEEAVLIDSVTEGRIQTITGTIAGRVQLSGNRNMQVSTIYVKDASGTIKVIWFRMPFLKNTLRGGLITLRGRIANRRGTMVMEHPEIFYPSSQYESKLNTMQPVYPLTLGLTNHIAAKLIRQCLDSLQIMEDPLPSDIRLKYELAEYNYAIRGIHFPEDKETFYYARERLVVDEFLDFILSIRKMKKEQGKQLNSYKIHAVNEVAAFIAQLPYTLTGAQKRVWEEILSDMQGEFVMSRLVQGDVGSGKTIVALLALLSVAYHGYQGALMAPTEVLARQHFESISRLLSQYGIPFSMELLTGSMTAKEKREACERIESGQAQIVIGTHALIQEKVTYHQLALVITDEQHRFGVRQREMLKNKGSEPHILVMSATPIPRTLAIILYGDLDISVIDELPASRLPIKNCVVDTDYRKTAYTFFRKQVNAGRQCYVICPMVEESDHMEVENVTEYAKDLQEEMGADICVGCLHGKMKQQEKESIMDQFGKNEIQILVSTTVIEVGIDVPNATVMMVENAERFGLAQLHQLRGRVGRGSHQSYCIFMSSSKSKETKKRLSILNKSNDGFFIASEDLKMRGPGDLFGIRQSGLMDFKLGDVFQDAKLLQKANEIAAKENLISYEKTSRVNHDNIHIL